MSKIKLLALVLVLITICSFVLTACNTQDGATADEATTTSQSTATNQNEDNTADEGTQAVKPHSGSSGQSSGGSSGGQANNPQNNEEIPEVTAAKPNSDTGSNVTPTRCTITAGTRGYTKDVGETFTYSCNVKTPKKIEDVQATLTYDSKMLELIKVSFPVTDKATVYNENMQNAVMFNAVNLQGFDFTKGDCLITAQFKVLKKGGTSISTAVEVMSEIGTGNAYVTNYKLAEGVTITESGK